MCEINKMNGRKYIFWSTTLFDQRKFLTQIRLTEFYWNNFFQFYKLLTQKTSVTQEWSIRTSIEYLGVSYSCSSVYPIQFAEHSMFVLRFLVLLFCINILDYSVQNNILMKIQPFEGRKFWCNKIWWHESYILCNPL